MITHIILKYFNVLLYEYYHINMTNQCGYSSTGLHLLPLSSAINENNTKFWKGHHLLIWLCSQTYFLILYTANIPQFGNNNHSRITQSRTIDPCVRYTKYPTRISLLVYVVLYIYIHKVLGQCMQKYSDMLVHRIRQWYWRHSTFHSIKNIQVRDVCRQQFMKSENTCITYNT